jgi:hypothetical protein
MIFVNKVMPFVIILVVCFPCNAVEKMTKDGKVGVFLTEAEFDQALAERKELKILKGEVVPLLKLDIEKYKILVMQKDQEIKIMDDTIKKKDELYLASIKLKEAEINKLDLKIENLEKWYRSPSVFLVSGVLLGGLLSVGLAFGLDEANR